jgi:hypothetical protein
VQQRRHADRKTVFLSCRRDLTQLFQGPECPSGEMIRAQGVLEPGVSRSGVNQEGVPDLPDVAKALNCGSIEGEKRSPVQADVVPEWIADDFRGGR